MKTEAKDDGRAASTREDRPSATESLGRRIRGVVAALKQHPGDEELIRILCSHVQRTVRGALVWRILSLRPSYTEEQCQALLEEVLENYFYAIVTEVHAGRLDVSKVSDPARYLARLVNEVFVATLDQRNRQKTEPTLRERFRDARYREGLTRAVAEMDEEPRRLVHLRVGLGLEFVDISDILAVPESAAKHRFKKASRELQDLLCR